MEPTTKVKKLYLIKDRQTGRETERQRDRNTERQRDTKSEK